MRVRPPAASSTESQTDAFEESRPEDNACYWFGIKFHGGLGMLDELKEENIVNKVGGRFKLSTLIQKRMVALNHGAQPLVQVRGGDKLAIVIQEILQDKIYLDMSGDVQTNGSSPGDAMRRAMLTDISD